MIKEVLSAQIQCYKKEPDSIKKTKIAQSIGYLGQTVNSMISSQEEIGFRSIEPDTEGIGITEDVVREFIRYEILENKKGSEDIGRNELLSDVIKFKKCDMNNANLTFVKMEQLGLKVCTGMYGTYDLDRFAKLRSYLTEEESKKATEEWKKRSYGS